MKKLHLLLVEDDTNLGQLLQEYLQIKGYDVTLARDGEAGFRLFRMGAFDLCILDVMLPKVDGFQLAEQIRQHDKNIPIIFLTARAMKEDTLTGFRVGGDDYLTKPFSMEELLMRIQAILRRSQAKEEAHQSSFPKDYRLGMYIFDYEVQNLKFGEEVTHLTSKEAELLKLLCLNKNQVLDRAKALKQIWLDDNYFNSRSMDVYITKLRKYLKNDEKIQIINVHGQGFKLIEITN